MRPSRSQRGCASLRPRSFSDVIAAYWTFAAGENPSDGLSEPKADLVRSRRRIHLEQELEALGGVRPGYGDMPKVSLHGFVVFIQSELCEA